jgi:hypothetical protein
MDRSEPQPAADVNLAVVDALIVAAVEQAHAPPGFKRSHNDPTS